jgi:hypothetical protein
MKNWIDCWVPSIGIIGNAVKFRSGPATVNGDERRQRHGIN